MMHAVTGRVFVLQGSFDQRTGQGIYTERVIAQLSMPAKRIALAGPSEVQSFLRRATRGFIVMAYLAFAIRSTDRVYWILSRSPAGVLRETLLALILRRHAGRIVVHLHGNELHQAIMHIPGWIRVLLRSSLAKFSTIVLCKHVADNLAKVGLGSGLKIVANTVDNPIVAAPVKRPAVLPKDRVTALFLSNLLPEKGVLEAIDAIEALDAMRFLGRNWVLNIAGGWSGVSQADRSQITRRIHGSAAVTYWGFADQEAKRKLFLQSDIFLFPSRYRTEAFPLALIEALLAGLPVVTTPVGCIPEMIVGCPHVATIAPGQDLKSALMSFADRIAANTVTVDNESAFRMAGDLGPRTVAGIVECQT